MIYILLIISLLSSLVSGASAYTETIGDNSDYADQGLYADTTYLSQWIPLQSGVVNSLGVNIAALGSLGGCGVFPTCGNGAITLYLYNSAGSLISVTNPITLSNVGWADSSVVGTNVIAGNVYYIGVSNSTDNWQDRLPSLFKKSTGSYNRFIGDVGANPITFFGSPQQGTWNMRAGYASVVTNNRNITIYISGSGYVDVYVNGWFIDAINSTTQFGIGLGNSFTVEAIPSTNWYFNNFTAGTSSTSINPYTWTVNMDVDVTTYFTTGVPPTSTATPTPTQTGAPPPPTPPPTPTPTSQPDVTYIIPLPPSSSTGSNITNIANQIKAISNGINNITNVTNNLSGYISGFNFSRYTPTLITLFAFALPILPIEIKLLLLLVVVLAGVLLVMNR